jgi:hypothetical protein
LEVEEYLNQLDRSSAALTLIKDEEWMITKIADPCCSPLLGCDPLEALQTCLI